ncbi:MAG: FAD-dependent monooxygenase [Pseudomonadota bacterium]
MANSLKITVAGAGIGGLAVAAALAQKGHAVRVAERAEAITEVGAGIQISPNGFAVLDALGLGEQIAAIAPRAKAVRLLDGLTGREVVALDLSLRPQLSWHFVHRAELIDLLLKAAQAAGVTVDTGREISPPPEGTALDGDDLLIGADGLKSALRARVDDARKPKFTGQVAWRAIIPDADETPVVEVHMGPGRHLVSYPLGQGRRNIVAVEEREAWAEEGWSFEDHPANLRAAFSGFVRPVKAWLDQIDKVYLWGLYRHPVAHRWFNGAQVLLGDAAHPTLPFLAQGANLALEDAWTLASAVTQRGIKAGLPAYQMARVARTVQTVNAATQNARNYHLKSPPVRFLGHGLMRLAGATMPEKMLARFDWLYAHDVTNTQF